MIALAIGKGHVVLSRPGMLGLTIKGGFTSAAKQALLAGGTERLALQDLRNRANKQKGLAVNDNYFSSNSRKYAARRLEVTPVRSGNPIHPNVNQDNSQIIRHVSGVSLPTSHGALVKQLQDSGFPSKTVISPTSGRVVGTEFILPDGNRIRVMDADGRNPKRASFENANGGPVEPATGKPVQPPQNLSPGEKRRFVRDRTHVILSD